MANITLKVDATLLRDAKILAARQGSSLSRLVAAQLEDLVRRDKQFERSRRRATTRLRTGFDLQFTPASSRQELHER